MMSIIMMIIGTIIFVVGLCTTIEFFHKGLQELMQDQYGIDTLSEYEDMKAMLNEH